MIEEAYVSFETAKLLKEKGFDELCNAYYEDYGRKQSLYIPIKRKGISNKDFNQRDNYNRHFNLPKENYKCTAPTQQMTMRWLREVHNIVCNIDIESRNFYYYNVFIIRSSVEAQYQLSSPKPYFESYEQACEAAIKYSLKNLI